MKRIMKHLKPVLLLLVICVACQFSITIPTQAATKKVTVDTPKLVSAKLLKPQTIQVKWKKVKNASGYRIYRRTSDSKWKTLKTITKNTTISLTDTNLESGTKYYYTVKAFKKDGKKTVWSKYDTKGVYAVTELPQVSVNSLEALSYSEISLSWNKVANVDGYYIYRHEVGGAWELMHTIDNAKETKYTDSSLSDRTKYFYTIQTYKNIDGITYKSKYNTKGWNCTTKIMTEEEAIEAEITETSYGIFVKMHNRSKNYYDALDIGFEAYDFSGKIVYKKTFENSFYHIMPDRTFYTSFDTPVNSKNQYINYAYCKIVPKKFGTINYKADIYDKIIVGDTYTNSQDTNKISVTLTNTSDEIVAFGRVLFLFYKNGELVRCSNEYFDCNVYDECEVSTSKFIYNRYNNSASYIDFDDVKAVIGNAFVCY